MRKLLSLLFIFFFVTVAIGQTITGNTSFCQGGSTTLSVSNPPASATYQWTKNSANIPGATGQTYVVNTAGNYNVLVSGVLLTGVDIIVNPNPVAGFNFISNNQCSNVPVTFTNTSTGNGLTYAWNFGDINSGTNNSSTAINPSHIFIGTPGNNTQSFNVTVVASDINGCKGSSSNTVTTKQIPGTELNGSNQTLYNGLTYFTSCSGSSTGTINLTNNSSTKNTNTNYRIVWGDNTSDFNATAFNSVQSHNYGIGTYTLLFIVNGGNGCTDTSTYFVFIGSNPSVGLANPGNTSICTGNTLIFPITNAANNPIGTTYTVTFNDGSTPSLYSQPPPASESHTFNKSSCGITSNGYNNSFSAVIQASNPCLTTSALVVPIYVSDKPKSNFSILPKDTICINSTITLSNQSSSSYINGNNCISGKIIWSITPATGWTTSGNLGTDNGTNDPSLWSGGSSILNIIFSLPGSYTIKLKTGNPNCGLDSITKIICVNPIPTASFTIDQTAGCLPLVVNTTASTNVPNCGSNTFNWSVSYLSTSGCLPNTSNYNYLNGTSASSQNPQFQFNNPGVYTINLTTIAPGGTCSTQAISKQITVKGKPNVTWNIPSSVCQSVAINPTASATCNQGSTFSYLWTFTGGTPQSSTSQNPTNIVFNAAGNFNISLDAINECGVTNFSQPITVSISPDITPLPASYTLCAGGFSGPYPLVISTGVTYTWTNTNTAIGLGSSGTITQFQPIPSFIATNNTTSPISGTVTVTAKSNGGCTSQKSYTITVNPKPILANQITDMCSGTTFTVLSSGTIIPAGTTYSWSAPIVTGGITGGTAGSNQTSITVTLFNPTNTLQTATYTVTPTSGAAGNCVGNPFTVIVNVYPILNISAAITNPLNCSSANGSIILSGLSPNTSYTVQYTKNGGGITTGTFISDATGKITITGLSSGTYTNISVTLAGCQSNIVAGPLNLIDPNPPATPTATANSPLCSGNTLNLTASPTIANTTYSWTGPSSYLATGQSVTRNNVTIAMAGTYSVTAILNGCNSAPGTVIVVINQTPSVPIVISPVNYCQNETALPLTATAATGNTLQWYTSVTGGAPGTTPPTPNTANVGSITYYVSQINSTIPACESGRASIIVNINPIPVITATSTNPTSCSSSNGTIIISGITTGNTYKVQFVKDGIAQSVQNLTATSNTIIISNLPAGVYTNINIITSFGCVSNILAGPFTIITPAGPATPTAQSNSPVCSGGTLNLIASLISGGTYSWVGPNGFSSTLQNPVRTNATTAMSGTYSVAVTLNGCTSLSSTVTVVVNQTPPIPTVITPINYCQNTAALPLTANATTGNTLNWYSTATGGISSSIAPNPSTTTAGTTTYYVSQVSTATFCESGRAAIVVNVNPVPVISASSNDPTSCSTPNGNIVLTGLTPSTSYIVQYSKDGGTPTFVTSVSNVNGSITIASLSAGTYTNITASLNGCTSGSVGPFTLVNPTVPATPTIESNSPLCSGSTLNLTSSAALAGSTYLWTGPNGFTSTLQNPVRANTTTAMSGTYSVTVILNGCNSATATINVTINQTPAVSSSSSNSPLCSGGVLNLTSTSITPGATFLWTGPNGFTSPQQNPTITNVTAAASGIYSVIAIGAQGNCSSIPSATSVIINAVPNIISSSYSDPVNCISTTGTITLNGLYPNTNYVVQFSKNGGAVTIINLSSNGNGNIIIPALGGGTYTNIGVLLNGCKSNEMGPITLVEAFPLPATPIANSNSPLCVGNTLSLSANSATNGVTYTWSGPNGFTSSQQNPTISNITVAGSGKYFVSAKLNNCISASDSIIILIGEYPIVNLGPDLILTSGTQYTMNSTILNGPISDYLWTPSTNLSCTNCAKPIANIKTDITYSLKATNIYGCSGSDTINIKVICEKTQVFIPDAFTPDGDGINDILMIRASGSINIKYFRIFNKWGELVFEKINFPPNNAAFGWNGNVKGIVGPPDVFVYTAEVMCDNGSTFIYKGNVSILK